VEWKALVNSALRRLTGYQLGKPPDPSLRLPALRGDRLLVAPVFILSTPRSGSTLLRVILGSHSQLHAPVELPLKQLRVLAGTRWMQASLDALRMSAADLEHMLWDRLLAEVLARSGKPRLVVKTPSNVLIWQRISQCWPDTRFIFLLRHPAAAAASLQASWRPEWHPGESGTMDEAVAKTERYLVKLEEARQALPGFTIRYEDLTAQPRPWAEKLCGFLGVAFEPAMLRYGRFRHGPFAPGLGDASDKIRSGKILPAGPPPAADIPPPLRELCAAWGYAPALTGEPAGSW
jgi:hypothetical protein